MLETRALVLDDDPAMVEMLGLSLRTVVRRVDQETDCRRAMELFATHKYPVVTSTATSCTRAGDATWRAATARAPTPPAVACSIRAVVSGLLHVELEPGRA